MQSEDMRNMLYWLVLASFVADILANRTGDAGHDILLFMQAYSANLRRPVDLHVDLICNCSFVSCDAEIIRFLGRDYAGLCRATGGFCKKRVAPDGEVVLGCLDNDVVPELFCATKQPMTDGSVMKCCRNQSFCNGRLVIELPPALKKAGLSYFVIFLIIAALAICMALFGFVLFATRTWSWKPVKRWIASWFPRNLSSTDTEEMLLHSPPSEQFGHLGNLIRGLYDGTSGSGSGMPSLEQRTIARQIELQREIGKGRFGEVWLGKWRGDPVAVKIFSSRDERSWNREVEIYQTNLLRHSNILCYLASDNKDTGTCTQLWLITEYHENGSLFDFLSENTISGPVMLQMIRGIADGLSFLHSEVPSTRSKPAIAHRDLKSKNILVKTDLTCVIADLGLAVRYTNGRINIPDNNNCGTVRYLAPEMLSDSFTLSHFESYRMADMYAVGLIIWEIVWRCNLNVPINRYELPYFDCVGREPSVEEMREVVCSEKIRPVVQAAWSENKVLSETLRIMRECWAEIPTTRLTAMNVRVSVDRLAALVGWTVRH